MRKLGTCRNPPNLLAMVRIDKMIWISSANFRLTQLGIHQPKLSPCVEGCSYICCSFIQKLCSLHLIRKVSLVVKLFASTSAISGRGFGRVLQRGPSVVFNWWLNYPSGKKHMTSDLCSQIGNHPKGWRVEHQEQMRKITNWTTSNQNYNHSWIGMVKWRSWKGVDCQSSGLSPRRGAFRQFSICAVGKRAFPLELCWKGN